MLTRTALKSLRLLHCCCMRHLNTQCLCNLDTKQVPQEFCHSALLPYLISQPDRNKPFTPTPPLIVRFS